MKKVIIASLIGLIFIPNAYSAENIALDDVVVTATRTPQPRESVIANVTVIDQAEIQRSGQSSLIDILQRQPSLEISNNGGAGKLSSIFIRGANSDHTLVLVDGIRINSATSGTTAFENLPVDLIERVEILRGPAASLYGQDAIGGVIQIFTKKGQGKPKFYASIGYGTYGTKKAQAGAYGAIGDTRYAFGVSSQDTDGFSALKTNDQNLDDKDGYRNLSATGSLSHQITDGHELGLQFLHSKGQTHFDNRFNTYAYDPSYRDHAQLEQYSYSFFTKNQLTSNWLSTLTVGQGFDEYTNYTGVGAWVPIGRSQFRTKQHQLSWQHDFTLPVGTITAAYDRLEERLKSTTNYDKTSRNNDGFYIGYLANIQNHTIHANYRSDHNSVFGINDTQSIAYGYQFNDAWRTNISYGKAFKVPSFNFLYYPTNQNPNLIPEKSDNVEASLRYEKLDTTASVTIYQNKVRDLILSNSSTGFTPFNVNKATLEGITLAASHQIEHWSIGGSIDIQSPRNEATNQLLPRRANRHAKANVAYQWNRFRIGTEVMSSSKRYNDAANKQPLAGYTLFNLTSEYAFNAQWKLQARLNNVFDKDYALAFEGDPKTTGFIYDNAGSNLFVNLRWESK
jgi:vitamin B12 transporter